MSRMPFIMEDAVDRRLILLTSFAGDYPARVAVAVEAPEVAARDFQPDAMAWQEHITLLAAAPNSRSGKLPLKFMCVQGPMSTRW